MEAARKIAEAYLHCRMQDKEVDTMELTYEKGRLKKLKYTCK